MAIRPIVRYMLLCDDWRLDPENGRRVEILGLLSNIHSLDEPPYPLIHREICVFLALTDGYGQGQARIACIHEETGEQIFETRPHLISFGPDPLEVIGVPFRIQHCLFPKAGLDSVQFRYEGEVVEERPLRLR